MIRKTIAMNEALVRELDLLARKQHRDFSSTLRYTLRIGMLAVENPSLTIREIKDIMEAKVDYEMQNTSPLSLDDI